MDPGRLSILGHKRLPMPTKPEGPSRSHPGSPIKNKRLPKVGITPLTPIGLGGQSQTRTTETEAFGVSFTVDLQVSKAPSPQPQPQPD